MMTRRRQLLLGLILLAFAATACNPLTVPYFLLVGLDPKVEPECPLHDKASSPKEDVKVVILAWAPLETREEFIGSERELVSLLTAKLQAGFKENKERVRIASAQYVQKWQEDNPNWQSMELTEIGQQIGADIVIDLGINHLSLYEENSNRELYRGRAEISITVVDARAPDQGPIFRKEYVTTYPRSRVVPVSDTPLKAFRAAFLNRVATDLSWYFTAHLSGDEYHCD